MIDLQLLLKSAAIVLIAFVCVPVFVYLVTHMIVSASLKAKRKDLKDGKDS